MKTILNTTNIFFLIFIILSGSFKAQTFNGSGGLIPDNGTSINYSIIVSGLPSTIDTNLFGIETVCINAIHTYDSDLEFYLVAPDGTQVALSMSNGGGGDNYTSTCFNYFAGSSIVQGTAPFTGTFKPQGQLGLVNNGQNPNGTWKIRIYDNYPFLDSGYLIDWSITFGTQPAKASYLKKSNIPIVILNTNSESIPFDTKITAQMGIIDNGFGSINYVTDSFNIYNGYIGIEIRGSSSGGFPQKQFSIETRDSLGNNLNVEILGMAKDNDWILYAPYTDKSLMRNRLTYELSNDMNRWAVKGIYCEVIINNEYQGIYEFTENIKQGDNRLDIANLTLNDTVGDDLTGGYILKIDRVSGDSWVSNFPPDQVNTYENEIKFQCIYPKPENILDIQKNYIQQYIDSFETSLASINFADNNIGWRKYADEYSFIDYFLLNELTKNVDAYTLSTFFFKDKKSNGGKLQMGPNWDYNLAWRNADYCNAELAHGWIYRKNDLCQSDIPFWWKRILEDENYINNMKCRWLELRSTILDTSYIFNKIDSITSYLNEAKDRHFNQWEILGTYIWPNPSPIANTYIEEIFNMKNWIVERLNWMDNNLDGECNNLNIEKNNFFNVSIFPNPTYDNITCFFPSENANIIINDSQGKLVKDYKVNNGESINLNFLKSGIYFVEISTGLYTITKILIKK
jgi:subtilisin-like proprotein convertase family protein